MNSILKGYLKFIGLITTAIIALYVIYYSIWALCLINNACYQQNFGVWNMELIGIINNWYIYKSKTIDNKQDEFQVSDSPLNERSFSYDFKNQLSAIDFANNNNT